MNQGHGAPTITVVIPTYRRPDLLSRCLQALIWQTLEPHAYEIIVVDDGSTEDTRALCAALAPAEAQRGLTVRYLRPIGTRGPAAARNRGWRAATGALIAFTDDDTIPDPDWLREGQRAMASPRRVAVWGRVHVPLPPRMTDNARNTAGLENAVFVTANLFVRRDALERVGGFDERYLRAWREDTDLYFALLAAAPGPDTLAPAPRALVIHPVREARFLVSIGQQANMAFDALLYKKYPMQYDRYIGMRRPPANYVAIVVATIAAAFAAPLQPALAAVCAAIALALILHFALKRLKPIARAPRQVADMLISSLAIPYVSLYWRLRGAWRWRTRFY